MKIHITGDLHITNKCPENRTDENYLRTCVFKLTEFFDDCEEFGDGVCVMAGDIFDNYGKDHYEVTNAVLSAFEAFNGKVYVIPGQHDLRYHRSGLQNTPLGSLINANLAVLLRPDIAHELADGTTIVGAGWEEEPKVKADILVIHKLITEEKELFPGQEEYMTSYQLLHKYNWSKVAISADNHKPHFVQVDDQMNINCGSMMRKSKDQVDYEPAYWILDTKDMIMDYKDFTIQPANEVFDFDKISKKEKEQKQKEAISADIDKFINSLPKSEREKPKFQNIVRSIVNEKGPEDRVKDIINEIMEVVS